MGADDALDGDLPVRFVDFDFGYRRDVGAGAAGDRDPAALSDVAIGNQRGESALLPLGFACRGLQTFARPLSLVK